MGLIPVNKRLVVEIVEDKVTESGIIVSTNNNEQIIKGKVISFANDLESLKDLVSVDDIILFNQQYAVKFKHELKTLLCVKEEDVLNILKK